VADVVLDSDVVIWHLRGRESVVRHVLDLSAQSRLGISAITRTEVLAGMREPEREGTVAFLDGCELLPVTAGVADRAGNTMRRRREQGVTLSVPDALIGATAVEAGAPLHTCNPRHFPPQGDRKVGDRP